MKLGWFFPTTKFAIALFSFENMQIISANTNIPLTFALKSYKLMG